MPTAFVYTTSNNANVVGYAVIPPGPTPVAAVGADDGTNLASDWSDGSINGGNQYSGYDLPWYFADTSAIVCATGTPLITSVRAQTKTSAAEQIPVALASTSGLTGGSMFERVVYGAYSDTYYYVPGPNVISQPAIHSSAPIPGITTLAQLAGVRVETGNVVKYHRVNFVRLEVSWTCQNPPAWTAAPSNTTQSLAIGVNATALAASDPDGDVVTYSLISGAIPPGLVLNSNGSFSGATTTAGSFAATFRATSLGGFADKVLTFNVAAGANQPPVYTAAATNSVQNIAVGGTPVGLVATDPEGDAITYSVVSGTMPAGLSLNANGTFSGTATVGGTYSFVVRATAVGGFADTTLSLGVGVAIVAGPYVLPIPPQAGTSATLSGSIVVPAFTTENCRIENIMVVIQGTARIIKAAADSIAMVRVTPTYRVNGGAPITLGEAWQAHTILGATPEDDVVAFSRTYVVPVNHGMTITVDANFSAEGNGAPGSGTQYVVRGDIVLQAL